MTFIELLDKACTVAHLPNTARSQLPSVLSDETKRKALKHTPEQFGQILAKAISDINQGSIKSVDTLVREKLH